MATHTLVPDHRLPETIQPEHALRATGAVRLALVINLSVDFGGTEIKLTEKWTLADDGKTLNDNTHIVAPQGEFDVTYVMNKK